MCFEQTAKIFLKLWMSLAGGDVGRRSCTPVECEPFVWRSRGIQIIISVAHDNLVKHTVICLTDQKLKYEMQREVIAKTRLLRRRLSRGNLRHYFNFRRPTGVFIKNHRFIVVQKLFSFCVYTANKKTFKSARTSVLK